MNCTINSASHFSGLQAGMSPISLVQLAGSVRKFNLNRPFILPILRACAAGGGGRESSFIYHWSKRSALPLLVTAWVVYLALPFSLHPSWVILPFATLFALCIAITASSFKKYL